jgi:FG-GAP repeat
MRRIPLVLAYMCAAALALEGSALGQNSALEFAGLPFVQLAELTASDGEIGDALGWSIAMSGNTVVVGAINANGYGAGAVYVFVKPQNGWANATQVAKLTGNGSIGSEFGSSIAISGNTVVVAQNADSQSSGVCVFVEPAGGWVDMSPTAVLSTSDGNGVGTVAISGNTIVAGSAGETVNGNSGQGAAYVYVRPAGGWSNLTQNAKLTASNGEMGDGLGSSVAVSGNTVVTGAYGVNQQSGAAYVFVKPARGWEDMTQTAELGYTRAAAGQEFGLSAAIDSGTIVVGAPSYNARIQAGAAYVFVEPAGGWVNTNQTAALTSPGANNLGASVSVNDGVVVAGAPDTTSDGVDAQGAANVFVEPVGGWKTTSHYQYQLSAGGSFSGFGFAVANIGTTVVAGAWDAVNFGPGAAYVFGP